MKTPSNLAFQRPYSVILIVQAALLIGGCIAQADDLR